MSSLPSSEIALWKAYELLHGLPFDRHDATTALAGAAMCQSWGAKVTANDLIPVYDDPWADIPLAQKLAIWAAGVNATLAT